MKKIGYAGYVLLAASLLFNLTGCSGNQMESQTSRETSESTVSAVQSSETQSATSVSPNNTSQTSMVPTGSGQQDKDLLEETQSLANELASTLKGLDEITDEGTSVPNN